MATGPVVVAVMSHRDPELIARLTSRVLEGENTTVVIHHDPTGEPHGLRENDRLRLVPDPRPCAWGRMNFADAMVRVMESAVTFYPDLSWVLLVSGQDYPAQPISATESFLAASEDDALLRWFPVPREPSDDEHHWQTRCRDRYLHRMRIPGSRRSVPSPRLDPFRNGTGLYIGDTWPNLGARAVRHVIEQNRRMRRVRRYLSRCGSPDEALLPTLLLNGDESLRVGNDRKRFIRWLPGSPHPATLTESDAEDITSSGDFFARKVDSIASAGLLDRLDAANLGQR